MSLADLHRPDLTEHTQVLGDLWLGQAKRNDHVAHRLLAQDQQVEDLPTSRFGNRIEGV